MMQIIQLNINLQLQANIFPHPEMYISTELQEQPQPFLKTRLYSDMHRCPPLTVKLVYDRMLPATVLHNTFSRPSRRRSTAQWKTVRLWSSISLTCAPWFRSRLAMSLCPPIAACARTVMPSLSFALQSASCCSSMRTMLPRPFCAATWRGVNHPVTLEFVLPSSLSLILSFDLGVWCRCWGGVLGLFCGSLPSGCSWNTSGRRLIYMQSIRTVSNSLQSCGPDRPTAILMGDYPMILKRPTSDIPSLSISTCSMLSRRRLDS